MITHDDVLTFEREYLAGRVHVSESEQPIVDWFAVGGEQITDNQEFYKRVRIVKRVLRRWRGELDFMEEPEYLELVRLIARRHHFNRRNLEAQLQREDAA